MTTFAAGRSGPFFEDLEKAFPGCLKDSSFFTNEAAELLEYGKDWTKVFTPAPGGVVFPRTSQEVATLVKLCGKHQIAIVPSGGRTGLAGGAVAARGELVLSLNRMNRIDAVDILSGTVRVQAGAITEAVHQHCVEQGLTWPVDFASKGSSHIGGNISTNAGGVNVIRYGLTRQWVLALEVVTAQGEILELNGSAQLGALEKNNTGVDLRQLFIGTEGTLGIITEATLKLTRIPAATQVFLFAVSNISEVLQLFREARQAPFTMMAYEFFTDKCFARVAQHLGARAPFSGPAGCYVLLEVESGGSQNNAGLDAVLDRWLTSLFERELVGDGVMAQSPAQAREFWQMREGIAESLFSTGLPHKNDVALPIAQLEGFCSELDRFFEEHYPEWEVCNFGHIGDGNLHINIMKPDALAKAEFESRTHDVDHDLFRLVRKFGGSISAEHGIGLLKKDFLSYSRTPAEMVLLKGIKSVLDPQGILNPGKIFDSN